ncbi:glucokinase [Emcibacter sp. SYSU 3D8]|uniref:glucokinase n=1 Tax=Emcibacter sp. SYSU 3D8 TaxID=3133969 RepID=UPI0031FF3BAA
MILAGDVGGTRTRLGLFETAGGALRLVWKHVVLNADHAGIADVLAGCEGLRGVKVDAACIGAAGPVDAGVCRMTNLDWVLDASALTATAGIGVVTVVNDLTAIAKAVAHLPEAAFAVLQAGTHPWGQGSMAVVAPGTGLGEAGLLWDGSRHRVMPSEGGHADFAPASPLDDELRAYLAGPSDSHVSWERVISGPGLADIAAFLVASGRYEWPETISALPVERRPAAIAERALAGGCGLSAAALGLFTETLAREGGNAVLRYLAVGGLCFAGGIPPAILPAMQSPGFIATLTGKGRMASLLRSVPVRVAKDPDAGLYGSARLAVESLAAL